MRRNWGVEVSHGESCQPVAVTCFVLLFNKGHYTCWSYFVSHHRSRTHKLLVKFFFLSSHSEDELRHELRLLPLDHDCFAHTHDVRPRNREVQMLYQNMQTYKVFHDETEVPGHTDGAHVRRRSSEQHLEISSALFFQSSGELGCSVLGPTCTHATFQMVE